MNLTGGTEAPKPRPSSFPKRCACGRTHDAEAWDRLDFVGVMLDELVLRNCQCSSTIAVRLQ